MMDFKNRVRRNENRIETVKGLSNLTSFLSVTRADEIKTRSFTTVDYQVPSQGPNLSKTGSLKFFIKGNVS